MKKNFYACLTALCIGGMLTLAIYVDHSKLIEKRAMLLNECDSMETQVNAMKELRENLESDIYKLHKEYNKLKFEKL